LGPETFLGPLFVSGDELVRYSWLAHHISTMTYNTKMQTRTKVAALRVTEGGVAGWVVPPVLAPILLAIMIGLRAAYLAYPW
jgi:hypothetical protein